jgi:hypothetical protein
MAALKGKKLRKCPGVPPGAVVGKCLEVGRSPKEDGGCS